MRYRAGDTSLAELQTNIPVVFSSLHLHCISSVGRFIFKTIGSVCARASVLCKHVCVCVYVCVRARARVCVCSVCVGVPSASRNAWVPPKLRWLPSAKMAARIPQSDSTREKEKQRQNECERRIEGRKTRRWTLAPAEWGKCCGKKKLYPCVLFPASFWPRVMRRFCLSLFVFLVLATHGQGE